MKALLAGLVCAWGIATTASADTISVVAAENFYGGIAQQVGGSRVTVTSIINNPAQDPHEFEVNASTARQMADAKLVIYNGAQYDAWAVKLLSSSRAPARIVIEVAKLSNNKVESNPHVWYDVSVMSALAKAVGASLSKIDPANRAAYEEGVVNVEKNMQPLVNKIAQMRKNHAGKAVTATEPVFGYMADALGLTMRNSRFQLAVMNETEPKAADIAAFERDLRSKAVAVLLYNSQTNAPLTQRMLAIAKTAGVPVVAVTESQPAQQSYTQWMIAQLDALELVLSRQ